MKNGKKTIIIIGSLAAAVGGYFLIKHLTKPNGIQDPKINPNVPPTGPVTGQAMATPFQSVHTIPTADPNGIVDAMIGKKVYANQDNAPVYLRDMTLYKRAKKDEYIMTVASATGDYYSDGVRQINKFAVHA